MAAKPEPHETELSRPYWDAARKGVLLIQKCANCGKLRHYPQLVCDRCHSLGVEWVEASGKGEVHSWTVAHHVFHPGFAGEVPYALVTVDLAEGVRALGRLEGMEAGALRLGFPVEAGFHVEENGTPVLRFRPAGTRRNDR
ncbi:Zn-ribbon domain-containing OB-fold protein [Propylenella binzhouense]|uniref:Zn-ribbon domain-containing OB-fold protein n=1 Tax=Propylenella binzhouense TaxID=2555902 RepID=A0A964T3J3_9HYPH|nr:Zn-ribbon domain-containing OB-fold protein [Propylenella binzhouense]MYZ46887.1 Zn-ribbon domain-containing OB-fold protein [Propylenella binzhouense]